MKEDLIWKYIIGELTQEEGLKALRWIKEDEHRIKEYHRLKRNYAFTGSSSHIPDETIDRLYAGMKKKMGVAPKRITRFLFEVSKYAAVMIVTLVVAWFVFSGEGDSDEIKQRYTCMETLPGQSSKVTLPDGTVVWLNSESKLEYSAQFGLSAVRDVKLQGEAYFDVTRDTIQPFRVITDGITVKVLGTSFNVEAYEGEDVVTTLVEGKVQLNNQEGIKLTDLQPGQQAIFSSTNKSMELHEVDTEFYASWKDGYIIFNNIRLEDIAAKLERFYNVDIVFRNDRVKNLRINGRALRNVPVDHLFRVLDVAFGLKYEIHASMEEQGKIYVY